ncbi:hypothetical protein V490_01596 [Pseudogymnoascus sp. VKM F-3557]|nr:hypothetical protein V490_01596 [Pseudogymnoascus sp. VKM F-3557]
MHCRFGPEFRIFNHFICPSSTIPTGTTHDKGTQHPTTPLNAEPDTLRSSTASYIGLKTASTPDRLGFWRQFGAARGEGCRPLKECGNLVG